MSFCSCQGDGAFVAEPAANLSANGVLYARPSGAEKVWLQMNSEFNISRRGFSEQMQFFFSPPH